MNRPKPDPAVVALAREIEQLRDRVAQLEAAVGEAQRLAEAAHRVLPELADRIAMTVDVRTALGGHADDQTWASWLAGPRSSMLTGLRDWLETVLIHYPGTAQALSPCWPHHPWVIEELLALQWAWCEAYQGERASGTKAVDWHDRHKPAVLSRISVQTAGCSVEAHHPGGRLSYSLQPTPGIEQLEVLESLRQAYMH